tara:strand:- start:363 stop:524 length:162 start_codon:yes stop_codon:yes gene_type:complete
MTQWEDLKTSSTVNTSVNVYEELKKLGQLRDSGVLTEEEFQQEKKKLLELNKN